MWPMTTPWMGSTCDPWVVTLRDRRAASGFRVHKLRSTPRSMARVRGPVGCQFASMPLPGATPQPTRAHAWSWQAHQRLRAPPAAPGPVPVMAAHSGYWRTDPPPLYSRRCATAASLSAVRPQRLRQRRGRSTALTEADSESLAVTAPLHRPPGRTPSRTRTRSLRF